MRENQQTRKTETQTLFHLEYGETHSKNVENEKYTLEDLEYGEKQ